jgi:hypothetical protein
MSDLVRAAQAVLDRWDSPKWEWSKQGPTAALMADLRAALAQQAEPVACVKDSLTAQAEPPCCYFCSSRARGKHDAGIAK